MIKNSSSSLGCGYLSTNFVKEVILRSLSSRFFYFIAWDIEGDSQLNLVKKMLYLLGFLINFSFFSEGSKCKLTASSSKRIEMLGNYVDGSE